MHLGARGSTKGSTRAPDRRKASRAMKAIALNGAVVARSWLALAEPACVMRKGNTGADDGASESGDLARFTESTTHRETA